MLVRILAALVLAPLVIALTVYLPTPAFAIFLFLAILPGLLEWSRLCHQPVAVLGVALLVLAGALYLLFDQPEVRVWLCGIISVFWIYQAFMLLGGRGIDGVNGILEFIAGVVILTAAWCALVALHGQGDLGPILAIAVLAMVWFADSLAYFSGKAFGRTRLAPTISPNKTVEGVAGGAIATVLFAAILLWLVPAIFPGPGLLWLGCALAVALISVIGDLYESRLKRNAGVKDSGKLIPGHGGMLDRIDGLVAGAPMFLFLSTVLQ